MSPLMSFFGSASTRMLNTPLLSLWQGIAGYMAGGFGNGVDYTDIDKLVFSNETASKLSSVLDTVKDSNAMISNSGTAGYVLGGTNYAINTVYTNANKISFSSDTRSLVASAFPSGGRFSAVGLEQKLNAGYISNGSAVTPLTPLNTMSKFLFASDTPSSISATTTNSMASSGVVLDENVGYIIGGVTASLTFSNVDKITFSTETKSVISSSLTTPRGVPASISNIKKSGYILGGANGPGTLVYSEISKLTYSSETMSNISAVLPNQWSFQSTGVSNYGISGYTMGGGINGGGQQSAINKLTMSNETISTSSATIGAVRTGGTFSNNS